MFSGEVIVVDPAAESDIAKSVLAPRLAKLEGAHIALVDNAKHMAEEMLREIESLLRSRYSAAEFSYYRKRNASVPTPPDVLTELAANCDAVVHGVAD